MIWTNQLHFNLISVFLSEYFSKFSLFFFSVSQRQSYPHIPLHKQENTSRFHLSILAEPSNWGCIFAWVLELACTWELMLACRGAAWASTLCWILGIVCDLLHSRPYLTEVTSHIYSEMINSCKAHFKCAWWIFSNLSRIADQEINQPAPLSLWEQWQIPQRGVRLSY